MITMSRKSNSKNVTVNMDTKGGINMKNIKILDNAVIVYFSGMSIKLKGKFEFADSKHVQTREGNNFNTITIHDDDSFNYEVMPFSLK